MQENDDTSEQEKLIQHFRFLPFVLAELNSETVFEELEAWLALKKAQGFIKIIQDNDL